MPPANVSPSWHFLSLSLVCPLAEERGPVCWEEEEQQKPHGGTFLSPIYFLNVDLIVVAVAVVVRSNRFVLPYDCDCEGKPWSEVLQGVQCVSIFVAIGFVEIIKYWCLLVQMFGVLKIVKMASHVA